MPERLNQAAREYFTWPIAATDEDGQAVSIAEATITFTTSAGAITRTAPVSAGKFRILIAGPGAAGEGAVVLPLGRSMYRFSFNDNPEVVVGGDGVITVS